MPLQQQHQPLGNQRRHFKQLHHCETQRIDLPEKDLLTSCSWPAVVTSKCSWCAVSARRRTVWSRGAPFPGPVQLSCSYLEGSPATTLSVALLLSATSLFSIKPGPSPAASSIVQTITNSHPRSSLMAPSLLSAAANWRSATIRFFVSLDGTGEYHDKTRRVEGAYAALIRGLEAAAELPGTPRPHHHRQRRPAGQIRVSGRCP